MVVEELYSHYRHPTTSILMGHARGVIILAAADTSTPVVTYSATRIKKCVTGNGRADKQQLQRMVTAALKLNCVPEPPDVTDALAAALTHMNDSRRKFR
jgi:crossover junction endodeoxyribonuclease RuvC